MKLVWCRFGFMAVIAMCAAFASTVWVRVFTAATFSVCTVVWLQTAWHEGYEQGDEDQRFIQELFSQNNLSSDAIEVAKRILDRRSTTPG
jgi:hypothetical protein